MAYEYELRPHHGMCIAYFKGKGYSDEFTIHMTEMVKKLAEDPRVKLVTRTDVICGPCPNNECGSCTSLDKVDRYDDEVLKRCHLKPEQEISYLEFRALVNKHILDCGKREEICGDCGWNALCK